MIEQQRSTFRLAGRKALGAAVLALGLLAMFLIGANADETRFLRLGTGSSGGTYAPIGDVLAEALSGPQDGERCAESNTACGVPGLVAAARPSFGAVENLENIRSGIAETGFIQSDIAYWALNGEAFYAETGPMEDLRALAGLYPEVLHIVVAADSDIQSPADLQGKRVSLGPEGSGTLVDATLLLQAYDLSTSNMQISHAPFGDAAHKLAMGELDAFFAIGGVPIPAIADLAQSMPIRLLPVDPNIMEGLTGQFPFFSHQAADLSAYGLLALDMLAVQAIWATSANLPDDVAYEITRLLWQPETGMALAQAHPRGEALQLGSASHCLAIPLHPGAARFYKEQGGTCDIPAVGEVIR